MKVVVTDRAWPDLDIERSVLEPAGAELVEPPARDEGALVRAARGADAILTNWARVSRPVIEAAAALRVIARLGVGLDNIDLSCATERGVVVTNVPDYCTDEVAEHALALLLALARNVGHHHQSSKEGRYDLSAGPSLRRLKGRTLGVVGYGNIGRALAARATGIGLRVIASSRSEAEPAVEWRPFDALLAESDFVSLHVPLTEETRHCVDRAALARMKPTAFLINTARGGLVDHRALAEALDQGRLAGAALDVQEPEPPPLDEAPFDDPRVIVTPHCAFVSEESLADLRRRAANQVLAALEGRTPENVVNGISARTPTPE